MTGAAAPLGVVYTPQPLAAAMTELALAPLIASASAGGAATLRVCDPAIGEGAFLIEIVRVLADAIDGGSLAAKRRVAETCVFGADVDARAVAVARARVEDFVGARVPALAEHLRVADALAEATAWPAFDAVIANPPYIRQERLGADAKRALRRFAAYDAVADLYVYFVELAVRIARRYCVVTPNKWRTAAYAKPLRALLDRDGGLERVIDFGRAGPLFADADAFACVIAGARGSHGPLRITQVAPGASIADAFAAPGHVGGGDAHALADRLAARWPRLGDRLPTPARGVVTGCNRAFVVDGAARARMIEADAACAAWLRPLVKGRDVRRWRPRPIERYLALVDHGASPPRPILDHLGTFRAALEPRPRELARDAPWPGRKPGAYRWFELQDPVGALARARRPRLFYQDIQTAPACCLDATGELVPDTTVWILDTDDRFALALLNSTLYGWFARLRFPPALNGAVRPKLAYLSALPLAEPPPDLRARIATIVDAQLAAPTPARDATLDQLICDAYELTARERALLAL